jgi:hypothetical protein
MDVRRDLWEILILFDCATLLPASSRLPKGRGASRHVANCPRLLARFEHLRPRLCVYVCERACQNERVFVRARMHVQLLSVRVSARAAIDIKA